MLGDSARHETTQVSPAIAVSANTPRHPATPDCRHLRPRFGEPASDVFCDQHFRRITLFENTKLGVFVQDDFKIFIPTTNKRIILQVYVIKVKIL